MQIHSGTKGHKYLACKCAGTSPPPNLTAAPCGFSALKFIFQISQSSNKAAAFPGALWRLDNAFSDTVMFARVLSQCITLWGSACSHYQPEPHLTVNLLLLQFTIRTGCFKKNLQQVQTLQLPCVALIESISPGLMLGGRTENVLEGFWYL